MNLSYSNNTIKLYCHDSKICLDQMNQRGSYLDIMDFKQNIFRIKEHDPEFSHYFKIKNGKIMRLIIDDDGCEYREMHSSSIYAECKCYTILDNILTVYSFDHK